MTTETTQPSTAAAKAVLVTLAAAQFVMILDASVMNVSIATVAKDLGTTVTGIQTAITLYTLVMASLMITGGKMGAILGRKRAFTIGCVIYACGSMTTALSPNLAVLMFGWSFLEGVGAALVMPAIVALVASNFGQADRPRAYGIVAAGGAIAVAVGPLIGGLFTTYWSWRYVFVGEVLVIGVVLLLNRRTADTPKEEGARLDLVGTGLSALGLGLVVYGILRSGTWGFVQPKPDAPTWLGLSPVIWLLLGGGAVLFGFLAWEKHRRDTGQAALLDPAILRVPLLRSGVIAFFFQYLLQAGLFFAVPLFLSIALGLSAIDTGVRILPLSITLVIAAVGIPKVFPHASPRRVSQLGFLALFLGLVVFVAALDAGAGPGDRHLADAPRRSRHRHARVAARCRHRLLGARRAERRGRRPPEHRLQPRHLDRHRARRRGPDLRAHQLVLHRHREQPGGARRPHLEGPDRAHERRAVHLRRRPRSRARGRRGLGDGRAPPSSTRTPRPASTRSAPRSRCSPSSPSSRCSSAGDSPRPRWVPNRPTRTRPSCRSGRHLWRAGRVAVLRASGARLRPAGSRRRCHARSDRVRAPRPARGSRRPRRSAARRRPGS